jgi:hypothetical protein
MKNAIDVEILNRVQDDGRERAKTTAPAHSKPFAPKYSMTGFGEF